MIKIHFKIGPPGPEGAKGNDAFFSHDLLKTPEKGTKGERGPEGRLGPQGLPGQRGFSGRPGLKGNQG